jgi:3-dehydroquinate synthase
MTEPSASHPNLPPHRKVRVDLGPRSYDVLIGRGALLGINQKRKGPLGEISFLLKQAGINGTPFIITDSNVVAGSSFSHVRRVLQTDEKAPGNKFVDVGYIAVAPGETSKALDTYSSILSRLSSERISRSDVIIALGGGVVGDLAGFVAATYLRGIAFVQVPTTLLAMVDSSVGGKTGVNLPEGKNLVGAFHQPKLVVADLDTLATLPAREFSAGMAEVIKYGAIRDKALFNRVAQPVKPDDADLDAIVEKCVTIKARIVEKDEFETKGERALLNFGHTIGHAIEKATDYKKYLHGEAISLGMRAAAWLSRREAGLSQEDTRDLDLALLAHNLPVVLDREVDSQQILAALGNDKKVASDGVNRWVLLTQLGEAESGHVIPPELVAQAVEYLRTHPDDL